MADVPVSVFISYSRTDSAFIDRLEADLHAYGFETWVNRQRLEGGADWARVIEQRILDHVAFIIALSPDGVVSEWVRKELAFALATGRHIIPIIARPIERAPIEIINLQYIDLSATYADHLQEVRVALLKTREAPPIPTPAAPPQPLSSFDSTDPQKGLARLPVSLLPPIIDLDTIFRQAQSAIAHNSLDLAEALLRQIVGIDEEFGNGIAAEELERICEQLEPIQIMRLRNKADVAHLRGSWSEEIGALEAIVSRLLPETTSDPSGESQSEVDSDYDQDFEDTVITTLYQLHLAQGCQKWSWLYDNAHRFIEAKDEAAAKLTLLRLWEKAPEFGDPAHITPTGLTPPAQPKRWDVSAARAFAQEVASSAHDDGLVVRNGTTYSNEMGACFVELNGRHAGAEYPIYQGQTLIGRSEDCDIFLEDLAVSRLHATVTHDSGSIFMLQDEDSANGTYVNGNRIIKYPLTEGDIVRIGATILAFNTRPERPQYPQLLV